MKRHQLLIILMLFIFNISSFSQRIDTLYYDNAGKGVETKEFASYIDMLLMQRMLILAIE